MKKASIFFIIFISVLSCKDAKISNFEKLLKNNCDEKQFVEAIKNIGYDKLFSNDKENNLLFTLAKNRGHKFYYILHEHFLLSYTKSLMVCKTELKLTDNYTPNSKEIYTVSPGTSFEVIDLGPKTTYNGITDRMVKIKIEEDVSFEGWCFGGDITPLKWEFPYVHSDAQTIYYPNTPDISTTQYITWHGAPLNSDDNTIYLTVGTEVEILDIADNYEKWDNAWYWVLKVKVLDGSNICGTISSRFLSNHAIAKDIDQDGINEIFAITTMDDTIFNITYIKGANILALDNDAISPKLCYNDLSTWDFVASGECENMFPIFINTISEPEESKILQNKYRIKIGIPFNELEKIENNL